MAEFTIYPVVMIRVEAHGDPSGVHGQDEERARAAFLERIDVDEIETAVSRSLPEGLHVVGIDLKLVVEATHLIERVESPA